MNKIRLMGVALAAVVTLISMSFIAFASKNTENSTRNIVKVAASNVNNTSVNISNKLIDISDDQAIQIAKKAIINIYGVDVDKHGFTSMPILFRITDSDKEAYKLEGPTIDVAFSKPDEMQRVDKENHLLSFDDVRVEISLTDGKVKAASFIDGIDIKTEAKYDENKLKAAAEEFLKEKRLRTDYKSIVKVQRSPYIPIGCVSFDYGDGTGEMISINLQNYKAYGYSPLNIKVLSQLKLLR